MSETTQQRVERDPDEHPLAERLAAAFHRHYEDLAPLYGYKTREASAVPWEDVPENNKLLMIAVADTILRDSASPLVYPCERTTGLRRGHLADLEVIEAILRSDPREEASEHAANPRAMADAVRNMIEDPDLHNPESVARAKRANHD